MVEAGGEVRNKVRLAAKRSGQIGPSEPTSAHLRIQEHISQMSTTSAILQILQQFSNCKTVESSFEIAWWSKRLETCRWAKDSRCLESNSTKPGQHLFI